MQTLREYEYGKDFYYIYVYLDPNRKLTNPHTIEIPDLPDNDEMLGGCLLEFDCEPMYIGKASSGAGYRYAQHLSDYLKNRKINIDQTKNQRFDDIGGWLKHSGKNWKWYKQEMIKVCYSLSNVHGDNKLESKRILEQAERIIIKAVLKEYKLVNVITYK